jgi:2-polyprenyl-6-methoxyphenol hydroxylase-like FAD-dependent oxidoreductase
MSPPIDLSNGVLVVDGGPVGTVAAIELARRGVPVRVVETLAGPTDQPRAAVLAARTLRVMNAMSTLDEILAVGRKVTAMEHRTDGRVLSHLDLSLADSPYPYSVGLPQTETERILHERLHDLGVHIAVGTVVPALGMRNWTAQADARRGSALADRGPPQTRCPVGGGKLRSGTRRR